MSSVTATLDIDAAPSTVWDVIMDPYRLHEWVTIHRALRDATATTMEQVLSIRGASFTVYWELTVSDPPLQAHWTGRGPARSRAEIEYVLEEPTVGTTRFIYTNQFRAPGGPLGTIASRAIMGHIPQHEADTSLARLKALIEKDIKPHKMT